MEKVKLNASYINTVDKNGNPLVSKKGRSYTMVQINYGDDQKASMYCDNEWNKKDIDEIKAWGTGTEVTLMFEKNGEYNNFSLPKSTDLIEARLVTLETRVDKLVEILKSLQNKAVQAGQ